jgi:AGCS family alanine or glycine:cation symporter
MVIFYVGAALFIILSHYNQIGHSFGLIISEAFSPRATIAGGIIGAIY